MAYDIAKSLPVADRRPSVIETPAEAAELQHAPGLGPSRRSAARSTLIGSSLAVLIALAQAFFLIPICLDQFGSRLYGAWLGATELLIWIQLLDLGIPNLMMQRIGAACGRGDAGEGGRWFVSGFTVMLGLALLLALLGLGGSAFVAEWADVQREQAAVFEDCFRLGVLASALLLLNNTFVGLSRGVQRTGLVNGTMVGGAAAGFAVALGLLLAGAGLWALAWGLVARALVSLAGGLVFLLGLNRTTLRVPPRPSRLVLREITRLVPSMTGGSVGYLAVAYSDIALVTTLLGPSAAAVYGLTRRAADAARSLLDTIAYAVYGGFAHLLGSGERERAPAVLKEILLARWACACLAAACYLAVNRGFVTLLFGAEHWGGFWLTVAFGVQLVVSGQSFLVNYLYRAAGAVREGSILLTVEAVLRIVASIVALMFFGMLGAPVAGVLVTIGIGLLTAKRLKAILPGEASKPSPADRRLAWGGVAAVALAAAIGALWQDFSWPAVATICALVLAAGGGALLGFHRLLRATLLRAIGG